MVASMFEAQEGRSKSCYGFSLNQPSRLNRVDRLPERSFGMPEGNGAVGRPR